MNNSDKNEFKYLGNLGEIIEKSEKKFKEHHGDYETKIIIFFDLEGSTELKLVSGHSTGIRIALIHNEICKSICSVFKGKPVKDLGDGLFAEFDCFLNACNAMINIQAAFAEVNISSRIGATSGLIEIVTIEGKRDILGSVVDRAARIASICQPGQMLIDRSFLSSVESFLMDYGDIKISKPINKLLKGIGEIELFQLEAPRKQVRYKKSEDWRIEWLEALENALLEIPDSHHEIMKEFFIPRVRKEMRLLKRGIINLTPKSYYDLINKEIARSNKNTKVYAVASITLLSWLNAERQVEYFWKNIEAAERGVSIFRLFVHQGNLDQIHKKIHSQQVSGISTRLTNVNPKKIKEIQDMVVFQDDSDTKMRCYLAFPDYDFPERMFSAQLIVDQAQISSKMDIFWEAWSQSKKTPAYERGKLAVDPSSVRRVELNSAVVTCKAAAMEKKIDLGNELKSLILESDTGLKVLHIPGDHQASLRLVKKHLCCKQARLASILHLEELGLHPGKISAICEPIWSMDHLLCKSLLSKDIVSTNDGTLSGCYFFSPDLLLNAEKIDVGLFSMKEDEEKKSGSESSSNCSNSRST